MREILNLAFQTFRSHRMRSFLTTLGIIIGVTTVIAILSLIEGLNRSVIGQIRSIGSDVITLTKFSLISLNDSDMEEMAKRKDLTPEDAESISKLPTIESVVPVVSQIVNKLRFRDREVAHTVIIGTTQEFSRVNNQIIEVGRNLEADDVRHRRNVGVIGIYVANNLFIDESPISKELSIRGRRIKIVGVFKKKGLIIGQNLDNIVIIPYTFFEKIYPQRRATIYERAAGGYSISILVKSGKTEEAIDEVRELMRRRHGLSFDKPDDFAIITQQMFVDIYRKLTQVGFVAIVVIAAISLLVGGIGIMNIMLVSVAERTREIGIRKAVGASNQDILLQFIVESVVIALVGGFIGIILGTLSAFLISIATPLKAAVSLWIIILGFGFSSAVGIFFGIYPAKRAAAFNPIEALRYD